MQTGLLCMQNCWSRPACSQHGDALLQTPTSTQCDCRRSCGAQYAQARIFCLQPSCEVIGCCSGTSWEEAHVGLTMQWWWEHERGACWRVVGNGWQEGGWWCSAQGHHHNHQDWVPLHVLGLRGAWRRLAEQPVQLLLQPAVPNDGHAGRAVRNNTEALGLSLLLLASGPSSPLLA